MKSVVTSYEKYFLEIFSAIQKKTLIGADIMFVWAAAHQPELYTQERALDEELNALWKDDPSPTPASGGECPPLEGNKGGGLEVFKAKVLMWGRVVLQIHKKYAEVM